MNSPTTEKDLENLRKLSYFYYLTEALNGLLLLAVLVFIFAARLLMYSGAVTLFLAFLNRGAAGAAVTLVDEVQAGALALPAVLVAGSILGTLALAGLIAGYFAGKYQREQRHHTFCMVMAGLTATSIPIGTAIGLPTFIILLREPVREQFNKGDNAPLDPINKHRQKLLSRLYILYGFVSLVLSLVPFVYLISAIVLMTGDFDKAIVVRSSGIPWAFLASAAVMLVFSVAFSVCVIFAGRSLSRNSGYVFTIVISAILSLFAPFGTILGIWALFTLFSDPVRAAFRTNKSEAEIE